MTTTAKHTARKPLVVANATDAQARARNTLSSQPGCTWQERWLAGGAENHPGATWADLSLEWLRDRGESASYGARHRHAALCHRRPSDPGRRT